MRSIRLSAFLISMCMIAFAVAAATVRLIKRGVALAFLWLAPAHRADGQQLGRPARDAAFPGHVPVDSALLNSLRHEAGMRPLRC